jgi:plastocyanin
LVAPVLLLAMSRSGRTAEVLSELAVTIRDRASMRLRVDAERARQRSEARFVVGFGAVVITDVIVFGQNTTFLDAYDSAAGQLVVGRRRPAAAYPAPAPAAEVTIEGLAYQPATVEVPPGATVHFTNTRTSERTVTAGTPTAVGEAFAEVLNGEGLTVDVVIEQPGEQRYFCQVHPFMRGEIVGV